MASRPRQWLDFTALYLLFLLARPLPRRLLLAVGRGLGALTWHLLRYRRTVVLDNLRRAFPERDEAFVLETARSFYRNLGMTLMEFLALARMRAADVIEVVDLEGAEHLQQVKREGRGALLVSGHFGNWELFAARAAAEGIPLNFIVKTQSNLRVDRIQNEIRHRVGIGTIRAGASIKEMIRGLRRGELIGLLADQNAGKDGVFLEFLGRPAAVFRGTAYLAWKLDCPIVTGYIVRRADGRHLAHLDAPIYPDALLSEDEAVLRLSELHVRRLEAAVRAHPDHYFWVHRRWKTRPPEDTP